MRENSSPREHELYQYKYLPSVLQGYANQAFKEASSRQVDGDIGIGYIKNTRMVFRLYLKELVQHVCIVGRSGAGKTNTIRSLQIELHRLGIPFMAFDLAKVGTRYLKGYMPELLILRPGIEFFFNPLKNPPGVSPKEWRMSFCEVTSEIFDIRTASKLYLDDLVPSLCDRCEEENPGSCPTMHDLKDELKRRRKGRVPRNEIGYINVILNKVNPLCDVLYHCLNVHNGIPIEELLAHPVGVELVGIKSSEIQMWIMSLILAWITSYRETQEMQFGELRHVFFFDEAAKVLGKGDS